MKEGEGRVREKGVCMIVNGDGLVMSANFLT